METMTYAGIGETDTRKTDFVIRVEPLPDGSNAWSVALLIYRRDVDDPLAAAASTALHQLGESPSMGYSSGSRAAALRVAETLKDTIGESASLEVASA